MGYWDLSDTAKEEADVDMLKIRVENTMGTKIERSVTKGILTEDEAKKLKKVLKEIVKYNDFDWWQTEKDNKSKAYEIFMTYLKDADIGTYAEEIELAEKIAKA